MRENWNDMPGDIVDEDTDNLPGGFGSEYDPDNDPDAMYDAVEGNTEGGAFGRGFTYLDQHGNTSGTGFAQAVDDGSTVDPADLLENEKVDKQAPSWAAKIHETPEDMIEGGMTPGEEEMHQQAENRSVETEGPSGRPGTSSRKKAA